MPPIPDEQRSPYPLDHNSIDDTVSALDDWMSFSDLKQAGIVESWEALKNWQEDPRIRFPRGRLFGPNARRWNRQKEIDPWLRTRPTERAAFDAVDHGGGDEHDHAGGDEAA
jgi:hypothetical protein